MSFLSSFGKKVSGAVHHLGQKAKQVVTKGTKFVADHSLQIAGIAHKVHDVAGTVSKVAGTIATGAALVATLQWCRGIVVGNCATLLQTAIYVL